MLLSQFGLQQLCGNAFMEATLQKTYVDQCAKDTINYLQVACVTNLIMITIRL